MQPPEKINTKPNYGIANYGIIILLSFRFGKLELLYITATYFLLL